MSLNATHTYATLSVSPALWQEVATKLRAAEYDHAFDGEDGTVIDMHGIGLVAEGESAPATEEVEHLKQEVASLRALLTATRAEPGPGIFVFHVPPTATQQQVASLCQAWLAAWEMQGGIIPPLLPVAGETVIQKLEYEGNGIFIMRTPHSRWSREQMDRIRQVWGAVWKRTSNPNVPLILLEADILIESMSDAYLQSHGLMRIPSETNFGG